MKIALIAAVSENGVIGNKNELPWKLRGDMLFFKETTTNSVVIMGRKTYESIGKPLPNRLNIVVSRDPDLKIDGVHVSSCLEDALVLAEKYITTPTTLNDKVMVIGGGEIYKQALPLADILYITRVHGFVEGDTYFPDIDNNWILNSESEIHPIDDKNTHTYSFLTYITPVESLRNNINETWINKELNCS